MRFAVMWKQTLLLLLSMTAFNAEIWNEAPRKFTQGNTYVYQYDAQILTGIPTTSWHYTGHRLQAEVSLQVNSMSDIVMHLDQIRFTKMNKEIPVDVPTVFLPQDLFEELSEEKLSQTIATELKRPVRFRWNKGVVTRLQVHVKDQFWSINMKKGVLNMLNMDLTSHGDENRQNWSGNFRQSRYEDGIEGRCRSVYHWNRLPIRTMMEETENRETDNMPITMVKARDLKDCEETAVFEQALFLNKDCEEKRMNISRDVVRAEASTAANLTYWYKSKEFFTWQVLTDSRYTFAPVDAKLGSISSFVKQNLTFVSKRPSREEGKQNKDTIDREDTEQTTTDSLPRDQTEENDEEEEKDNQLFKSSLKIAKNLGTTEKNEEEEKDDQVEEDNEEVGRRQKNRKRKGTRRGETRQTNRGDGQFRDEDTLQMIVPIPEVDSKKNMTDTLKKILMETLSLISNQLKEKNSKVMTNIQRLVVFMRQAPVKLLQMLHEECLQKKQEEPDMLDLFYDLLPAVATKESLKVFVETAVLNPTEERNQETEKKKKSTMSMNDNAVARRMHSFAVMNSVVQTDMIRILLNLAEKLTLRQNVQRRETLKAVLMTIGTLTRTYMDHVKAKSMESTTMEEKDEDIQRTVYMFFQKLINTDIPALKKHEKVIVVCKAIGNSVIRKGITTVSKAMFDQTLPVAVRVQCIYAMRNFAPSYPEEVRRNLLPIFFDVSVDAEMRIASYLITIKTRPTRVILDSIVESIRREPVKQVQSFVLSHMKNIVEAPCHCDCMVMRNISHILETVNLKDSGIQYSHVHRIPLTESELAVIRTGVIFTPDEFLPRSAMIRILYQGNGGKESNLLELGIRAEGLQKLLSKLMASEGNVFSMENMQMLRRELGSDDKLSEINLAVYMKMFGEDQSYRALDEQLKAMLEEGFNGMPDQLFKALTGKETLPWKSRRTIYTDATMRVPTTFGLPFTANFSSVTHINLKAELKMKRGIFDEEMIHAQLKMTPLIFTQHSLEGGIDSAITKTFTQIKLGVNIPQVKDLRVNVMYMKTGKTGLRLHVQNPEEEMKVIEVKSTMKSIYQEMKQNNEWSLDETELPIKFDLEKKEAKEPQPTQLPVKPLGLEIETRVSYPKLLPTRYPVHLLMRGPIYFSAAVKATENKNEGLEIRVNQKFNEDTQSNETTENSKMERTVIVRLLRTSLKETDQQKNEEMTTVKPTPEQERPVNKKLRPTRATQEEDEQLDKDAIISELNLNIKMTEKHRMEFLATLQVHESLGGGQNEKLELKGLVSLPKQQIQFSSENPLRLLFTRVNQENVMAIQCRLTKGNTEFIKYKITFDMDQTAQKLFARISENIQEYQALHPIIKRCAEDIQKEFANSPACFFTWRYMNMFNRMNHTLIIPKTAPKFIKPMIDYLLAWRLATISPYLQNVLMIDNEEEMKNILLQGDDFAPKNGEADKMYHVSVTASPFDLRMHSLNYLFDATLLQYRQVMLPTMWLTHMHPTDNIYTGIVRRVTETLYPATCYVHVSKEHTKNIMTFDGFMYNVENAMNLLKGKRVIFAQDTNNKFQVSMQRAENQRQLHILTADTTIKIVRPTNQKSLKVLGDGKEMKKIPTTIKNDRKQVMLSVENVPEYVYGGENVVRIHLPMIGVTVKTDMETLVHVEVSPFFHSTLRGVCGDFDGERRQEIKSSDCKKFYLHPENIFRSEEYVTAARSGTDNAPQWLSLKQCKKNSRLMPLTMKKTKQEDTDETSEESRQA